MITGIFPVSRSERSNMANDIFLKVDGIKGEATDVNHPNEIEVVSWNWGVSESFRSSAGSGVVGGSPKIANLVVRKHVDKASPLLLKACATGEHIKDGTITVRNGRCYKCLNCGNSLGCS